MLFQQNLCLEIEWDENWYKDQKVLYHIKFKVEKIKSYGSNLLNLFKLSSLYSPRREGKKVIGKIIQSDIEIKEKTLILDLPLSFQIDFIKGDLLDLSISEKGWCIQLEKIDP